MNSKNKNKKNGSTKVLREYLRQRAKAIKNNELVEDTNQNGIYYIIRPLLQKLGIDPDLQGEHFRRNLTNKIGKICQDLGVDDKGEPLSADREQLGIFASTSAFFFYRGQEIPINYNNALELMKNGTDIILIEKEGTAKVLRQFTDKAGIATITNRGFFVDYAGRLAKNAETDGANIAMITDFDVSGLLMERSMHEEIIKVPRLGIDFKTLEYFGLNREQVEEHINTDKSTNDDDKKTSYNHWEGLNKKGPAYWRNETNEEFIDIIRYLEIKRIEIDSVITQVGNKKFVDFIIDRLAEEFPTRNYNRVITVPEYVVPPILQELHNKILTKVQKIVKDKRQELVQELSKFHGVIDNIDGKESEIEEQLLDLVYMNTNINSILDKIENLADSLDDDEQND